MICFVGDCHIGNFSRHGGVKKLGMNERCALTLRSLDDALAAADAEGASTVVLLGDLLDGMNPPPQLIAEVRRIFRKYSGLRIVLMKGNHDSGSDEALDTAIYAVTEPNVLAVDAPMQRSFSGELPLVLVPFRAGKVSDWLPGVLEELRPRKGAILCLHAGIRDNETAPWLREAPDAIDVHVLGALMDRYELGGVFAGNWHEHQTWPEWGPLGIHQVGALCPTGYSNLGIEPYGHVALVGSLDEVPKYLYIPGPRFLKVESELSGFPKEVIPDNLYDTHTFFIEWKVPPEDLIAAKRLAAEVNLPTVGAITVLPDATEASTGIKRAATAARRATSVSEAISRYVARIGIPAHLDRARIESRVRRYMDA